jgi:LuxR family transcriptional regulator, maltose regulon positive regulatory protein
MGKWVSAGYNDINHDPVYIMAARIPITQTKISIPRRRNEILTRQRLLDILNEFLDMRLNIIAAPAGYGKTSLLIDFAHQSQYPVCWQAIDPLDQNIIRFLSHFIAAIQKRFPQFGGDALSSIADANDETINLEAVCTAIVNDLYEHVLEHFVIILDDYHLLGSNPKAEQFIGRFINSVDENCHLFIASRALLTLPDLPLLVAQSQVGGLSYEELSFNEDEIRSLFKQNRQLDLSEDAVDNLLSQTEGWITGVVLATQILGPEASPLSRIRRVTGISLYDYLSEQVFFRQTEKVQKFLLLSSLLEEFDAGLCREVLAGCMGESNPDWSGLLAHTLKNSLFALPVGEDTLSVRYHHLFRDFLRQRAFKEYPEMSRIILLRLASHFRKKKDWVRAHEIYQNLGDRSGILEMLIADGSDIQASGNLLALSDWLAGCKDSDYKKHPELLSLLGSVRIMRGQVEEALVCLDKAIPQLLELHDRSHIIRALLRHSDACRLLGKYQQAIKDAMQALSLSSRSPARIPQHAKVLRALGINYYHVGSFVKARSYLQRALGIYQNLNDSHNTALLSLELGLVLTCMGEYQQAEDAYTRALGLWSASGNLVWQANLCNNLGVLYHQTGQMVSAVNTLERAHALAKQSGYRRLEAFSLASIGEIYRDLGADSEMEQAYLQAEAINDRVKDKYLALNIKLAQGDLMLRKNDLNQARLIGNQALEQARKDASDFEIALAWAWQGKFLTLLGEPGKAINSLNSALEVFTRERDIANGNPARLYLSVAQYMAGEKRIALKGLARLLQSIGDLNQWNNLIIPARELKQHLHDMLGAAEYNQGLSQLLALVADFEEKLSSLRRQIRQRTLTVPFGPPRLSIRGLGTMQVKLNNKLVTNTMWQTILSRDLFFYMLQHPGGISKEAVGLAFWPDAEPGDMKLRFKNAIYRLRRAIGKEVILFEDDRYLFNRSMDYEYDVDLFLNELAQAQMEDDQTAKLIHLRQAILTYKGSFLPGFDEIETMTERERLQQLFETACISAAEIALKSNSYEEAIRLGLRAIEVDPYLETGYQVLFKAYATSGNKSAIVKLFKQLESILQKDLSTSPTPETIDLYRALL